MKWKAWLGGLGCAIALSGCSDDGGANTDSTTGSSSTSTDDVMTTIPVTSVSETNDPTNNGTSSSSGTDTDTDTDASSSGTVGTTEGSSSSSGGGESSSTTTGDETTTGEPTVWEVGWCNLQYPPTIAGTTATVTTAYSRVYVEGLTDQTVGNDIDAQLVVEFGYGADGSDPGAGAWTWVSGAGNFGWNGMTAGEPNNDEYQGDLQFGEAGTFDYAARVSGDGGTTWVYCDLDGLVEGGYTSDQAGDAVIE